MFPYPSYIPKQRKPSGYYQAQNDEISFSRASVMKINNTGEMIETSRETFDYSVKYSFIFVFESIFCQANMTKAYVDEYTDAIIFDHEKYAYTFFCPAGTESPKTVQVVKREHIMQYYTVITRGKTAHIFIWRDIPEDHLRYDAETPGIRIIGTFISMEGAKKAIKIHCPEFSVVLRSCLQSGLGEISSDDLGAETQTQKPKSKKSN